MTVRSTRENTAVIDQNGNVATFAFWGNEKKARASLETLYNCFSCENCHNCIDCDNCESCKLCIGCVYCVECNECFQCNRCKGCTSGKNRWEQQDLTGDLPIIPRIPNIDKKIYAATSKRGALNMYCWHNSCGTSHCRAGWVVVLAGNTGSALEDILSTSRAAWLIYAKSGKPIKMSQFFVTNAQARRDMRLRAQGIK